MFYFWNISPYLPFLLSLSLHMYVFVTRISLPAQYHHSCQPFFLCLLLRDREEGHLQYCSTTPCRWEPRSWTWVSAFCQKLQLLAFISFLKKWRGNMRVMWLWHLSPYWSLLWSVPHAVVEQGSNPDLFGVFAHDVCLTSCVTFWSSSHCFLKWMTCPH